MNFREGDRSVYLRCDACKSFMVWRGTRLAGAWTCDDPLCVTLFQKQEANTRFGKFGDKVYRLEDNVTIGIYWTNQRNVPPDEAKLLRANLGSFVRQGVVVANLPPQIGAFDLGPPQGPHRKLYLCASLSRGGQREEVGYLVDNPNASSGIPGDGTVSRLDYVDGPRGKPERHEKQPPGFGWDPGYGDD